MEDLVEFVVAHADGSTPPQTLRRSHDWRTVRAEGGAVWRAVDVDGTDVVRLTGGPPGGFEFHALQEGFRS